LLLGRAIKVMNTKILASIILSAAYVTFAEAPSRFEIHAISEAPSASTTEQSLPGRDGTAEKVFVDSTVLLGADTLRSAEVALDRKGHLSINIYLTEAGSKKLAAVTADNVNKRLGFVIAGKLRMAPLVREPITGGKLQITGTFTPKEAAEIVEMVRGKEPQ
jgi:preprotein translocase subunit SecD